jgi:hypothetical protein
MKKVKVKSTIPKIKGLSEDAIQKAVAGHLNLRASSRVYWFHVPNGGSRNLLEATKLKAMGTRAGVADLVLIIDGHSHFLELKTAKGRPSRAQMDARTAVEMAGGTYAIARGIDEALDILDGWGAFAARRIAA